MHTSFLACVVYETHSASYPLFSRGRYSIINSSALPDWANGIRTRKYSSQSAVPYHLAITQYIGVSTALTISSTMYERRQPYTEDQLTVLANNKNKTNFVYIYYQLMVNSAFPGTDNLFVSVSL